MGEEEFYIDNITNLFIQNVLTDQEKQFNLNILYGKDTSVDQIISICKKYPIMSNFQIVLIKEAQHLNKSLDKLIGYIKNPLKTTILIINYKHNSIDKRKLFYKELKKTGKILESKKLYDNQVQNWISEKISNSGFSIDRKSVVMINEHLGNSLSKISKEIDTLLDIKASEKTIVSEDIEKYIGISKQFNNYELRRALGEKNFDKAFQICNYFSENPNSNPLVVSISVIFDFFNKLLLFHVNSGLNEKKISQILGINPYFISEYRIASNNYNLKNVVEIISIIRDYDMYTKGVMIKKPSNSLLTELVMRVINLS